MVNQEQFIRQAEFYDPHTYDPHVTIVGAGGIGSPLALQLSMLGVRRITVIDKDKVERHNLNTTVYTPNHVGQPKVMALKDVLRFHGYGAKYIGLSKMIVHGDQIPITDILMSAVDSMHARDILIQAAIDKKIPLFIDGRIGGEYLRVYTIQPHVTTDRKFYTSTLVNDNIMAPLPCTARSVVDIGGMTASLMTRAVRMAVANKLYHREVLLAVTNLSLSVTDQRPITRPRTPTPRSIRRS